MLNIHDEEFLKFGQVLNIDTKEILDYLSTTEIPETGNLYVASDNNFERVKSIAKLEEQYFGKGNMQAGYCNGNNELLNCTEYHGCIEINVAFNDVTLFLATQNDIKNSLIDSKKFSEVLLKKGEAILLYPGTLHFSPVVVNGNPFRVAILLKKGTNTPLVENDINDRMLWMNNKWLIAHKDTIQAQKGAYVGITGENRRGSMVK